MFNSQGFYELPWIKKLLTSPVHFIGGGYRVLTTRKIRERCVKNVIDLLVLKALEDNSKCGYEVIGFIHNTFQVLVSPGTIYPLLESLEKDGFVESTPGHKKKLYKLTLKGKDLIKSISFEYARVLGAPSKWVSSGSY